jgi:hypothetical protein
MWNFSKLVILILSALGIASQKSQAAEEFRSDHLMITVPRSTGIDFNSSNFDINEILGSRGVYLDEKSTVQIHEESEVINFDCFDCIVRDAAPDVKFMSPYNKVGK